MIGFIRLLVLLSSSLRVRIFSICLLFLCLSTNVAFAQMQDMRKVELAGTMRLDNLGIENASVTVYKNNQFLQELRTDAKGEFTMFLDLNCSYKMEVTAEGLITKRFVFDTKIPFDAPLDIRLTFDFIVSLFPWFDDPDLAILDQPLGIIKYDNKLENFNYDKEYTKTIISRLEQLIKRFNARIKEYNQALGLGDTYFNMAQYPKARENYVKASAIFPKEKYPIEKIAEIDRMNKAKVDDDTLYSRLIKEADQQAAAKVYQLALSKYERASDLKPNQQYPKDKIYEIGKIVFGEEALQQKYSQLILDADNAFNTQDYSKAINLYDKASTIKPTEQYPKDQVARAKAVLEKQKEIKVVATVDEKYSKIVAAADQNFNEEKYVEAKDLYIQANMMKSAEQYPKDQLAKISDLLQQQMAINEAYKRAITMGDKLYNEMTYQPALDNYQRALNYKPNEQYPKDKIAELTKLMMSLLDVELSYKNAIAEGDKSLSVNELKEARDKFVFAGTLKPNEQYPKVQIVRIDNMLADIESRKELDAKYKKYMEDGDRTFGLQQYDLALSAYKQATSLKPSEQLPKDQIAKINLILAQSKNKEEQYAQLIESAEKMYVGQDYNNALGLYQKALGLKPTEQLPTDRIAEINKILTAKQDLEASYKAALAEADNLFIAQDYTKSKTAYQKALDIKPTEQYPKDQMGKIDRLLAEQLAAQSTEQRYKTLIAQADKYLGAEDYDNAKKSYSEASTLKASEQYPKDQLAKINQILADRLTLAANYAKLITAGDQLFGAKTYDKALLVFTKATELKPSEKYPKEKIAEINKLLLTQRGVDESYKNAITEADNLFTAQDYAKAKTAYAKASDIKPSEKYPQDQITKIDQLLIATLAAQSTDQKYKTLIAQADKYFTAEDYTNAKQSYTDASAIKSTEQYPKDQIAKINQLLASMTANDASYAKLITAGDQLFGGKLYDKALLIFTKASELKPSEKYPKDKIAEINKLIAEKQGVEASYKNALAEADKLFTAQDYTKAKTTYKKASDIKPTEQYPKDQIARIDKLLADQLASKSTDEKYKTLITLGDKFFTAGEYSNAQQAYTDASGVKPAEQYPKDQLAKINLLLTARATADAAYTKLITAGDQLYGSKAYDKALLIYTKASDVKPSEKYPKDKITEINKLIADQLGVEQSYKNALAEADKLFTAQDYAKAKTAYQKASDIKSAEKYPKDQILKIDQLLTTALAAKSTDEKYKTLIAQADKYFTAQDYDNAKKSYTDASGVKATEQYPKDQLAKISQLQTAMATTDAAYTKLIAAGDQMFGARDYSKALLLYDKASKLKPAEKYPQDKIAEINKQLASQQGMEEKYKAAIAEADKYFSANDYTKALDAYTRASGIKPTEQYPKDQITKINSLLASTKKLDADYAQAIADGDKAFLAKDYTGALTAYTKASSLKSTEKYPKDKITEINTLMASLRLEMYKKVVAEADASLVKKDYTNALSLYDKASKLIASEVYPKQKIAEINKILENQNSTQASYTAAIVTADKAFTAADYTNAKISYQMALKYKAGEAYPTGKITECDKKIAELAVVQQDYQKFITEADRLYNAKDYINARVNYVKANGKKPNEDYPTQRITEIDGIVNSTRKAEYEKVIGQADYFFNLKDYKSAKDAYLKASGLQPTQQYPKDKIVEINKMQSSEGYGIAIAKADAFFNKADYANARSAYMEALGMRANEIYPRQRIQECSKKLTSAQFASAIDQIKSEFIESNTTRKYTFSPIKNRSTANYLSIKARNLSGKPFKIILNFGVDDSNVGGVVLNIENNSDVVIYTPLVGEQSGWVVVENNWMSLSPIGGDIEILGIKIEQGNK